ncbi:hypothetical protein [Streptomyces sp. NBC_01190]|uniref:hypothetical protein n=1 Tax=Streptomyces sp. NBC_01190 TaxID=2903767 RepID=UPI0038636301|nr:Gfo/Idh/MocA family oxidoreductase [Streptomyces sp. NBC_01190]
MTASISTGSPGRRPFPTVIVGYGRAGRDLHHQALRNLFVDGGDVLVVEPEGREVPRGCRLVPSLRAAARLVPVAEAVWHVTTPPQAHLCCVEEIAELGGRRLILEKPVAPTAEEAARLEAIAADVEILPVSVWPSSRVTEKVRQVVASGEIGEAVSLFMEQSKPRFGRTLSSTSHQSALEVELPHQMLLALHLAGPRARLLSAETWPMPLPARSILTMGGALLRLEHAGGMVSTLLSDLTSPVRRRRLRVAGTHGEVVADYPISSDDPYGQVKVTGRVGRSVVADAPLTHFIDSAYAYFAGLGPRPPADLELHRLSIHLLEEARDRAVRSSLNSLKGAIGW